LSGIVVTGQQIGLLGSPLYTTYKVLGALHLAREIGGQAVFWLETHDADFNEINHIDFLDAADRLQTLTWSKDSGGYSCGLVEVDENLVAVLETFFTQLRQTEFTPALREMALDCYQPGLSLGEASTRLAFHFFSHLGVEIFDPMNRAFLDFSRSILLKEAERTSDGEQCNLFCLVGKKREALFKKHGRYVLRDGREVNLANHDLLPNVKTRSMCQDAYFKTHTYVAGPAEIEYLAGLDHMYDYHGVKKPQIIPRMSLTLLEPRVMRQLKKTGLSVADVLDLDRAGLVKKVIKEQAGFDLRETEAKAEAAAREFIQALDGLGLQVADLGKRLSIEVKALCGRKRASEKEKHEGLIKAAQFLSANIKPLGKKQERVFNLFYYMNLYGGLEFLNWLGRRYDRGLDVLEIEHGK